MVCTIGETGMLRDDTFLPFEEATRLFRDLLSQCAWRRRPGMYGRPVPREEAYYGDPGTHYTYSKRRYEPLPWPPALHALTDRVQRAASAALGGPPPRFNAVLCNLYRDGNDSVGWHADAEPEMGPVIASLSLGAERTFRLREKKGAIVFADRLPHGCLLIMPAGMQQRYLHEVTKEPRVVLPRINLTFRRIEHP